MKKNILKIIYILCALLILPFSLGIVGFSTPAQFGETYYGVLPKMYRRLQETEGKRIVVVGGSAAAFGLQGELIESELEGYMVCPFGLYGSIGMKTMMDLARSNIREGDIVLLAPEQGPQSLSLYFNGEHVWKGIDGHFEMLAHLDPKDAGSMIEAYPGFLSQKYEYFSTNSTPIPQGVYAASSFNENLTMIYDRPYNQMLGGFDGVETISYEPEIFSLGFADYANEFNHFVQSKGATLLYAFTPMNIRGIKLGTTEEQIDAFYDYIDGLLDFEILGNPHNYIFESGWFYDSNVHVNSAGAIVYTRRLTMDLKTYFEDYTNTSISMPSMPIVPEKEETGADGKDAAFFEYKETGYGYEIIGLTEEGKQKTSIEIPDYYNGKKVLSFTVDVFQDNDVLQEVHIGKNIARVANGSFKGCTALTKIYMSPSALPSDCSVYEDFFQGTTHCKVYVPQDKLIAYKMDYWWARHAAYIEGY